MSDIHKKKRINKKSNCNTMIQLKIIKKKVKIKVITQAEKETKRKEVEAVNENE